VIPKLQDSICQPLSAAAASTSTGMLVVRAANSPMMTGFGEGAAGFPHPDMS
jgi:hypothetical protein